MVAAATSNQVNICWSNRIIHIHTQSTEIHQRPACCAPDRTLYLFNVCLNIFFTLALFSLPHHVCVCLVALDLLCGWRGRATTSQVACAMMNQKEKYCQIGDINHPCKGASARANRCDIKRFFAILFRANCKNAIPLTCVWIICECEYMYFTRIYLSFYFVLTSPFSFGHRETLRP